MEIEKTLSAAGVTPAEFAKLVGVSKNMVYKWIKGASPHSLRIAKVTKILAALKQAVEDGDLPLAGLYESRVERIQTAVLAGVKKAV